MREVAKAVIFDMDGVLINSEHLWRKAMIKGFNEFGMSLTEDDCRKTMGMRFGEVVALWLKHFRSEASPAELEKKVIDTLLEYIHSEGEAIEPVPQLLAFCREKQLKLGLATSSSTVLMNAVLKKLGMEQAFDSAVSAENLRYGKPHPEVFLKCAAGLGCDPSECIVIEDSLNGVIAAKAAQMKVIAVPDDEHTRMQQFAISDHKLDNMQEVLALFNDLFRVRDSSEFQQVQ
jgi:mannitol-1-/sugar-/sorbitol-6-/2-deoxyglucose-6-phosphatase